MRVSARRFPMPHPFLKWVGGKGQLLPELRRRVAMAQPFGRYHEPFVGGGALFFDLFRRDELGRKKAFLSDHNQRLIDAYQGLLSDPDGVIAALERHAAAHDPIHYYAVRAEIPASLVERAARIIYLNKTCFNGLFRENSRGEFNVPMGRYKNPAICDAENLRRVADALKKARIEARPFESVIDRAKPGDLVYFDPPYHPISATSSFTGYHKGEFGESGQRALAEVVRALTDRNVKVMLSNSLAPLIRALYQGQPGYAFEEVQASRVVNSRSDRRGKIGEALVRNF